MKKLRTSTAIGLVAAVMLASLPAKADVEVFWDLDKNKVIDIDLRITKAKGLFVDVVFDEILDGAAEAHAVGNASIIGNTVTAAVDTDPEDGINTTGDLDDFDIEREATILDSMNANTGIVQVNQDAGNASNQGNFASAGLSVVGDSAVHAEGYLEQLNIGNSSAQVENPPPTADATPDDVEPHLLSNIEGSLIGNVGVVHLNQNSGNMNNQHNALAAAVGDSAVYALSDAGLGQEITSNTVKDLNTIKFSAISGSVNDNTGIVNVNQSSGHMNNQATIVSVAAISSAVGL